jgi:serine/threonine-protein kinase
MSQPSDEREAAGEATSATDTGISSSGDSLQKFLERWAKGELDRAPDSKEMPAAASAFAAIEAVVGEAPRVDLKPKTSTDGRAPDPTADLPRPSRKGRRYQVVAQLGEGGMGEVYLAFDEDLRRHLAMKTLRPESDKTQIWRFLKEAQVLGQLGHPNIVTVYEMGLTESQKPYYTMPVVHGETLHAILTSIELEDLAYLRVFSLTRLIQIFLQVALAVEYAHVKGVVHRDIKPANIMVGEHGEVMLLDWGVAKLLGEADVSTEAKADITQTGFAVGTPTYMAPEQVEGEDVDARTDVYALGLLLYEILTLDPPFTGKMVDVMMAHLQKEPTPPRERAPSREIPLELERSCLKALAKSPDDRHQSARELHDEVQVWLEAASDRAKRRERASELASRGKLGLDQYYALKDSVVEAVQRVESLRHRFHDWQSVEEKKPLFEAEDEVGKRKSAVAESASEVVMTLSAALGQDPEHPEARRLMAEFYWDRLCDRERHHDFEGRDYFSKLVASFHDGRYTRELRGDGSLSLTTSPSGADVTLYQLEERQLVLSRGRELELGVTPIAPTTLRMGSYVAVVKKDGYPESLYPIWISRNRRWQGTLRLRTAKEIGDGLVFVPGGPFVSGGDEEVRGWSLPPEESELEDFFIARYPVTVSEYLDFLDELSRRDPEEALRRSPRRSPDGGFYFTQGSDGRLAPPDGERGVRWRKELPVVSISWHDAVAYCEWRSKKDGRVYRLPTELEWEKSARGVDGRWYPWGTRFDPSLCNVSGALPGGTSPQEVDLFPADESIYGVRGLAGNVRDWTATRLGPGAGGDGDDAKDLRVVRGGAFNLPAIITRSANRFWLAPGFVVNYVGFRLASSPSDRP